jgi:hypothetical protein
MSYVDQFKKSAENLQYNVMLDEATKCDGTRQQQQQQQRVGVQKTQKNKINLAYYLLYTEREEESLIIITKCRQLLSTMDSPCLS